MTSSPHDTQSSASKLTRDLIVEIAGELSDAKAAAILATEAAVEDVEEAVANPFRDWHRRSTTF